MYAGYPWQSLWITAMAQGSNCVPRPGASPLLPETGQSFFTDSLVSRKRRFSHKAPQYGLRSPAWSLIFPQADMAFLRSLGRADHPLLRAFRLVREGINHRRLLALCITLWI